MAAYDAFLLLSFGGPEGPDDVLPFLENVTRGRGIPRERLAEVAEHYHAYGGVSPINAQCRDLLDGDRGRVRGRRHRPAAVLGQQELAPVHRGHGAPDEGRRRPARGRVRDLRLQLLLRLPPVPGRHRPRGRRRRPGRPPHRQDPPVLQPPRLHRAVRGRVETALAGLPAAVQARCPPGVHRAQRPGRHGRRKRQRVEGHGGPRCCRRQVRGRAAGSVTTHSRTGAWWRSPLRPRLPEPERPAERALAGAGRQRPPRGAGQGSPPERGSAAGRPPVGGCRRPGRLRQRPHGGRARPGRGSGADRGVARPPVRPGQGPGPDPEVRRDGRRTRGGAGLRRTSPRPSAPSAWVPSPAERRTAPSTAAAIPPRVRDTPRECRQRQASGC